MRPPFSMTETPRCSERSLLRCRTFKPRPDTPGTQPTKLPASEYRVKAIMCRITTHSALPDNPITGSSANLGCPTPPCIASARRRPTSGCRVPRRTENDTAPRSIAPLQQNAARIYLAPPAPARGSPDDSRRRSHEKLTEKDGLPPATVTAGPRSVIATPPSHPTCPPSLPHVRPARLLPLLRSHPSGAQPRRGAQSRAGRRRDLRSRPPPHHRRRRHQRREPSSTASHIL